MADQRKPFERIIRIHNRLQLRKPHVTTLDELMSLCQVSERCIKGDFQYMRDVLNAPVAYNRRDKGWTYTEDYDISKQLGFTENQFNQLRLGLEIIDQISALHLPNQKEIDRLKKKLQIISNNSFPKYIYFEELPYYKGSEVLGYFIEAIEQSKAIYFEYEAFKTSGIRKRKLYPYALKENANRWYVIGKLPNFDNAVVTYALDRIKNNEELFLSKETFERDTLFDIESYFKYTYGLTVLENPVERVLLSFTPLQAKYFLSKPFFPFEIIENSDEKFIVTMYLIPNWEFIHKILSYGSGVEILGPESLRDEIIRILESTLNQYK